MRLGRARFVDSDGLEVASIERVSQTQTTLERTKGLLGRTLTSGEALWITPCNSVHSFGMSYPIDLVYLDKALRVRKLVIGLSPFRASFCLSARSTLELMAGQVAQMRLHKGMKMEWLAHA